MELAVGTIVSGKVTTITKFGAFVALADGKSGLVHISEVANTFVNDVHDFLEEGQEVQVKVLAITPDGKINLSIKQTQPRPAQQGRHGGRPPYQNRDNGGHSAGPRSNNNYHHNNNGGNYHSSYHSNSGEGSSHGGYHSSRPAPSRATVPPQEPTFEDKLKQFMTMSDNKISELNRNRNRDGRRRKKK